MMRNMCAGKEMAIMNQSEGNSSAVDATTRRGMVLPFTPLSLAFNHVNYYVDMPAVSPNLNADASPTYMHSS